MKRTIIVLLAVAALVGAAGVVSARMGQNYGNGEWFDQMSQWMGQHMGGFGSMMGYAGSCPGYGAGYYQEAETLSLDETTGLLEAAVDGEFTTDVYQMGRWYVVFYEDSEGDTKQARVDAFTGEVITDFYEYMSRQAGTYNGRGYRGGMMWGY